MIQDNSLETFQGRLLDLARELSELFNSGNVMLFSELNRTIKEMYRLQHENREEIFRLIDPDCEVIYKNFDMIIAVLRTTEDGVIDKGAQTALNTFLHNIANAINRIGMILEGES